MLSARSTIPSSAVSVSSPTAEDITLYFIVFVLSLPFPIPWFRNSSSLALLPPRSDSRELYPPILPKSRLEFSSNEEAFSLCLSLPPYKYIPQFQTQPPTLTPPRYKTALCHQRTDTLCTTPSTFVWLLCRRSHISPFSSHPHPAKSCSNPPNSSTASTPSGSSPNSPSSSSAPSAAPLACWSCSSTTPFSAPARVPTA